MLIILKMKFPFKIKILILNTFVYYCTDTTRDKKT